MPAVCDCTDVCKIPAGQPQPIASCRGLENQTVPPAAPVKRLYDALSAMMYGWEDDSVRLEAFAALKETADWLAAGHIVAANEQREHDAYCVGQTVGWDNAVKQLENWGSRAEASALRRLAPRKTS